MSTKSVTSKKIDWNWSVVMLSVNTALLKYNCVPELNVMDVLDSVVIELSPLFIFNLRPRPHFFILPKTSALRSNNFLHRMP